MTLYKGDSISLFYEEHFHINWYLKRVPPSCRICSFRLAFHLLTFHRSQNKCSWIEHKIKVHEYSICSYLTSKVTKTLCHQFKKKCYQYMHTEKFWKLDLFFSLIIMLRKLKAPSPKRELHWRAIFAPKWHATDATEALFSVWHRYSLIKDGTKITMYRIMFLRC